MDLNTGPRRANPVPPVAARGCGLPLYASFKLSGSVDPYLSSEPFDWRQLNPGSVESQSPTAPGETHLFATGVLEIFQDLSTYFHQQESCQPRVSMGNVASTSCSASVGELNTPDIGAVNAFEFIGSANDNINHFGGDFSPEALNAFLNSAEDVKILEDEQKQMDNMGLSSPNNLSVVEHEEVVEEYVELSDPLSCRVKCESASDSVSVAPSDLEEQYVDSKVSMSVSPSVIQMDDMSSCFEDLPVFLPQETVTLTKPKLNLGLVLDPTLSTNVIGTPEVLQLLCEAEVDYGWSNYQSSPEGCSEVSQSSMMAEPHLPKEECIVVMEEINDQERLAPMKNETVVKPPTSQKMPRKRKAAVEDSSAVTTKVEPLSPEPTATKRPRRVCQDEKPSEQTTTTPEPRRPVNGKRQRSSTSSTVEEDICQKYRELRDRNNEASRRSRLNRKAQDEEMKKNAEHLEEENEKLRKKVEELERLRDKVKEALFRIVKGNAL